MNEKNKHKRRGNPFGDGEMAQALGERGKYKKRLERGGSERLMGKGGKHHKRGRGKRPFDYGELRLMVLSLIAEKPSHGYELIKQIEEKTQGVYAPSPGVIYPTISWLQDMSFVEIEDEAGRQKTLKITDVGKAFVEANAQQAVEIWTRKHKHHRKNAPREIVIAMDGLKAAIKSELSSDPSAPNVTDIATKIANLASEIDAQKNRETEPDASETKSFMTRHKLENGRRALTVKSNQYLTPNMIRIILTGDELQGFTSLGADDHIKLLFPSDGDQPHMRDYTPRAYDEDAQELTIDFAIHDAGPATQWAINAQKGDVLNMGGPRGSKVIAPVFDWWLLIGDETALPAIGRRVEELPSGTNVITLVTVEGATDEQNFDAQANVSSHWVHRPAANGADPDPLLARLEALTLPQGKGFIWIAAEAGVARAVRDKLLQEHHHPKEHLKAAGYWVHGAAAASDKSLA